MGERRGTCGHAEVWRRAWTWSHLERGVGWQRKWWQRKWWKRKCRRIRDTEKKRHGCDREPEKALK